MSIMLPGELVEVMDILGFNWPQADEDKIFECGQAWKDYASDVERVIADADRACREAVERNRGEAITAFEGHWRELGGQGDLRRAADAANIVSDALESFGYAVIAMKTATITQLGIAAAAVIASVASAIFTAGLSTLAGAAAVQAVRIAIREIIQELIEKLVKNIIPKLRHEAGEIFEQLIKRLRRYLDELVTKLRQTLRRGGGRNGDVARTVTVSRSRWPQTAQHIDDAQAAGHPSRLTIDRAGQRARRRDALRGTPTRPGLDRDEYPPAMFREGGQGASVRHIDPSDNQGAGASIGNQLRDLPDGSVIRIETGK